MYISDKILSKKDTEIVKRSIKEKRNDNRKPYIELTPFCAPFSRWTEHVINIDTKTNLENWDFNTHVSCPSFDVGKYPKPRQRVSLQCDEEPRYSAISVLRRIEPTHVEMI